MNYNPPFHLIFKFTVVRIIQTLICRTDLSFPSFKMAGRKPISLFPLYDQYERMGKIPGNEVEEHHSSDGVWLVRRRSDSKKCVEKSIKPQAIPAGVAKMEIELIRSMHHPGVVAYVDAFIQEGQPAASSLYTEFAGGDLQSIINEMVTANRYFHVGTLWSVFKQLLDVSGYLAYGIPFITEDSKRDAFRHRGPAWKSVSP